MKNKKEDPPPKAMEIKFSKTSLLSFKRYKNRRDLLSVLLKDGQTYTFAETDAALEGFMKGKVK